MGYAEYKNWIRFFNQQATKTEKEEDIDWSTMSPEDIKRRIGI